MTPPTAIFTVADARAFRYQGQTPLAVEDDYPDELIEATAARISADFERIAGVAFVPTTVTDEVFDGPGDGSLLLPRPRVTAVTAAGYRGYGAADWTAYTVEELAGIELDSAAGIAYRVGACWPRGSRAVKLTYTHGYATPPEAIKRAALILAVEQLAGSNVSARATQATNEFGTYNLSVAGWREQSYYGLPEVDSVLARYSARTPMVG